MTYEIKYEPEQVDGNEIPKYNVYYTGGIYNGLKEFHSTDGINGTVRSGYIEKNGRNWHKLEQDLRYSAEFVKAFQLANSKGFNMFTTTLVNGKLGQATENALAFCFASLGVEWTEQEKTNINNILAANNFEYRLA